MNIAIIDAEIVGKHYHRFPNLACMKISAYYKSKDCNVKLIINYDEVFVQNSFDATYELRYENSKPLYDKIFISKVFTDTFCPAVTDLPNVYIGGTGFFYDKAEFLPKEIEHIMPDYHLYDEWLNLMYENYLSKHKNKPKEVIDKNFHNEFKYYIDYSIGFLTRGCFRQCPFCVNQNSVKCLKHSCLSEFIDESRPKLCFLDDNFFACSEWKNIIDEIKMIAPDKKFVFKQGLDERLLNDEKIHEIMSWNYDGRLIFAFDNIDDADLIESKLKRIKELYPDSKKSFMFYVLCGYDRNNVYDDDFWLIDIENTFKRMFILAKYGHVPYIMRYEKVYKSKYAGLYSVIAAWGNQASFFRKKSFAEYAMLRGIKTELYKDYKSNLQGYIENNYPKGASWKYLDDFVKNHKDIANKYFYTVPEKGVKLI